MLTKKHINIKNLLIIFVLCIAAAACNNDFLKQEQTVANPVADTIRMTSLETTKAITFNLANGRNSHWRIFQLPSWVKITPMEGNFSDGKSSFQIELNNSTAIPQWGILSLPLVFDVDGLGYVQYPFLFLNYGYPQTSLSPYELALNYQSTGSFTLYNTGGGILFWEVQSKPSWLTLSEQNGYLNANTTLPINLSISRDNLAKGDYSGEITIATNSVSQPTLRLKVSIKVFDPTISGNAELIEGEVVDAEFCKATGSLVVATKNPNRIYLYNSAQAKKTLELQKIPINVAISEKGDQVAASFTNTDLSVISPESLTIQKNIQTGIISSDLALGDNGWAYLAPKAYDTNYLISVDLNSGQVVKNNENMNGLTWLKKVPGKSLLYGSKIGWSPDFLLVFDTSSGAVSPVIDQWRTTLSRFWPSEDGQRIFTGNLKIYQSPNYQGKGYIAELPQLLGQLESLSGTVNSIAHSVVLNELFVACKSYSYEAGTQILRIDGSGYFVKKTVGLAKLSFLENGSILTVAPEVPYLYVSKSGKELYLVKSATGFDGKVYWYYEKIML